MKLVSLLCFITFVGCSTGLKIVVYSSNFGYSHMNFMGKVADTLQNAGHEVTVVQPRITSSTRGTGCSSAKVVSVPSNITEGTVTPRIWDSIWTSATNDPYAIIVVSDFLVPLFDAAYESMMNNSELLYSLREEKFDLAITELFDFSGFALFHKIDVQNIVGAHSNMLFEGTSWAIGAPTIPSYVPAAHGSTGDEGSLWERVVNLAFTYYSYQFQASFIDAAQQRMDKDMPEAPQIWETMSNLTFVITNMETFLDFPRPTLEKVVDIGGIGLKKPARLNDEWSSILKLRPKTVLISFGSVAPSSSMPQAMKQNIVNVLKKFPDVTFIWKYETPEDGLGKGVDNVILTKWQPQTDLLADGRLSLFITHGGAGSVTESAHLGVPLITIPLFGDQMRNAQMVKRNGFGVAIDKSVLLSESSLEEVLRDALENETLNEKAKHLQRLLSKKPFSAKEKLIKTIELAAEFGSLPNLAPSGRHMSLVQYLNLDILVLTVILFCAMMFLVVKLFTRICQLCCSTKNKFKQH